MLEDQVAFLLQKYLGNYVRGLNKEALKISVWRGDVELTNMQLKPEALNSLKLPVRVKAGFLGSVKLKVPWSRLGQEPVLVYLDRIFILAEPATQVEGCNEDAVQEAKRSRVREMEIKLLERQQQLKSELNSSWLGSFISTVIGNIKLSIGNIHIRYEDVESNPGHPFAAGLVLSKLSAVTVDDLGKETFATGGDLDRVKKSVELESLAMYFNSDSSPWTVDKPWEDLLPSEWSQIFEFPEQGGSRSASEKHSYILQPVSGKAKYTKLQLTEAKKTGQALQNAAVDLDDVTLSLSRDGYRDILKMADNFSSFNQRLRYAHLRPSLPVKSDPRAWWKYAYKVVTQEIKKSSGSLSWEQLLRYARLRKEYVSLYASLLKSDMSRLVVDDHEEIKRLDRELDTEVILQWRMLAHKFVEQSAEAYQYAQQNKKQSWWSFGWTGSSKDEEDSKSFTDEDWERLNRIIGYKGNTEYIPDQQDMKLMQFDFEIHMKHNASKLTIDDSECLADLSCQDFCCNLKMYPEAKIFDLKLGSYRLLSPYGVLAESADVVDSFVGIFSYKPFDQQLDWSLTAKASPCYITYLKDSIDQIVGFFKSSPTISQNLALETAAAVQLTLDEVKRTAQQQMTRVLKDQSRFSLNMDIAAPKITVPTKFRPDDVHETKLLLDLGNLVLRTEEIWDSYSSEEQDIYLNFNLVLSDVSAFLVDGDYHWNETSDGINLLPVIDKCGIALKLQQIQLESPLYPSTRMALRVPSLGFHFSPARYHRLMEIVKIFQDSDSENSTSDVEHLWDQADFEGWSSLLAWKGVGNREAAWQRRYLRLVGPFLYVFENSTSTTYKQWFSLRGKQVHQVPAELTNGVHNILALHDSGQVNPKILEDTGALIFLFDTEEGRKIWQSRLQGAIYRASGSAAVSSFPEVALPSETNSFKGNFADVDTEKLFVAGILDELKICFSCGYEVDHKLKKVLLAKESSLFEFRAVGGQVELSVKSGNLLIGTILRSLEIEDQYYYPGSPVPRFLARSFINSMQTQEVPSSSRKNSAGPKVTPLKKSDSEENFYEASDDFDEFETPMLRERTISDYFSTQNFLPASLPSLQPPTFSRIPGLIPDSELQTVGFTLDGNDTIDSFVKAQIVIYDQHSPQYNNLDNRVVVTVATLTFFCHRPTVIAIMEFMNAINLANVPDTNKYKDTYPATVEDDTYCNSMKVDVVCLQETKMSEISHGSILTSLGSDFSYFVDLPSVGASGGILVAWRHDLGPATATRVDNFSVSVQFCPTNGQAWWLTCVYGPQGDDNKVLFLQELREIRLACQGPWLTLGDYNLITSDEEKNNSNLNRAMMGRFRRLISDLYLKEVPLHGRKFTWSNQQDSPTLVKLDRVLCSTDWEQLFPNCLLQSNATVGSDHCPLLLGLHEVKPCKARYHFEAFWTKLDGFQETVEAAWNSVPVTSCPFITLAKKFQATVKSLQSWSHKRIGHVNSQLDLAREILHQLEIAQDIRPLSNLEAWLRNRLKHHSLALSSLQRTIARSRSRIDWLNEGDANTALFHLHARHRKRKNFISKLLSDDGHILTSQDEKEKKSLLRVIKNDLEPEPAIKGLLAKGKSRIVFHLTSSMAEAQILLMNENGDRLATLSQNNLSTDIKVFTSSFSIKAALGNLKISDDSLRSSHPYFWVCDMRNPGGRSFVEIDFTSFNVGDEDYCGYDYSLVGQLSQVRIVYLNRFVQEIISYFMGLVPKSSDGVVKLKDDVTNSEKWVSKTDMEGSPALKLDVSFSRPIIVMPRETNSADFLELDVLYITVQNEFRWIGGDKNEMSAVHLDILTVTVKDINLVIGMDMVRGETIIQDVEGLSFELRRSLRDLRHQLPAVEAAIKVDVLKAALSNREYEIISECALSNFSETPRTVPTLNDPQYGTSTTSHASASYESIQDLSHDEETWISNKFSVSVNLVELSLHSGSTRDSPLASVQASGAWLLYKSNTREESFLYATLKGFSVFDDREGTKDELRLAIGKSATVRDTSSVDGYGNHNELDSGEQRIQKDLGLEPIPSMLILDAIFRKSSSSLYLCVQRPKFLVALDFLLAIVEFFVPSARSLLSNDEDKNLLHMISPVILNDQIYYQEGSTFSLSPQKPLIVDSERFDHFIYDGKGGKLYLLDREGKLLSRPSSESFIHVLGCKRLQFRNVTIVNGEYLDSCVSLGDDCCYSASENDCVYFIREDDGLLSASSKEIAEDTVKNASVDISTEFIMELQAIGPELTFYSTSRNAGENLALSTKVIHARTDAHCRLVMKGGSMEMNGNILGLKMESNGIRVIEPFDMAVKYSNASGKTNLHVLVSEIYMNFSFSILRLFLAVEEEISAFLRMSSKKMSLECYQFDKVTTVQGNTNDQVFSFWRPRAPSGYAIFGDYLTPMNDPPTKRVLALNTNVVRVKRPLSYKLVCQFSSPRTNVSHQNERDSKNKLSDVGQLCSVWLPVAPTGYVAMGCVVSPGAAEPPLSSVFCLTASLVSSCNLRDCIALRDNGNMIFWRVDNSFGSFLPGDPSSMSMHGHAYDLRHMLFNSADSSSKTISRSQDCRNDAAQLERSVLTSGRLFEAVASFKLIWSNSGTSSPKKLSIWRPMLSEGMFYFGDIAVNGYEPPNSAVVLRDTGEHTFLRAPEGYDPVGRIKKHRGTEGISFWFPKAPSGFVALGCVASKNSPEKEDFRLLRCIRSDMVMGGQFSEESVWDSSSAKTYEPFSLWTVDNDAGTFLVRSGYRKPPKRLALKLAGPSASRSSDNIVVDAEIKTFSAVSFDDYGGMMVPLFGMSFDDVGLSYHGGSHHVNATVNLSFVARSYSDKYSSWEPFIEPMDGFLRYQYDMNTPGSPGQLRITSTRDLNVNVSVSNTNMLSQAYASWNNISLGDELYKKEIFSSTEQPVLDVHRRRSYYVVPQNKLGQDIYIRTTENSSSLVTLLPSGDDRSIKVPASNNLLDSHLNGKFVKPYRLMVTAILADAEIKVDEGLAAGEYMTAVRLFTENHSISDPQQQSARTCAAAGEHSSQNIRKVNWNEMFFFKVESEDSYILELLVLDAGKGQPVGIYSAPLKQVVQKLPPTSNSDSGKFDLTLGDLMSTKTVEPETVKPSGKIRFAVLVSGRASVQQGKTTSPGRSKTGYIQISPSKEGPWTNMKLNYAVPAACWRFGNCVIASEATVKEGNRYLSIRSLVSVTNTTNFVVDLRLKARFTQSARSDEWGKDSSVKEDQILIGMLEPNSVVPVPLPGLSHAVAPYMLQLRPAAHHEHINYSWSDVQERRSQTEFRKEEILDICVSDLYESENLLFCSQIDGTSSSCHGLWFCLSIEAKEIGKDVNMDPVYDWSIIIKSPLCLAYYLPIPAHYTVSSSNLDDEDSSCSHGALNPGEAMKVHNVDPRNPLYLSLIPHGGWEQMHEPVLISHPTQAPSKFINLRSSLSRRIVQIVLEQSSDNDYLMARVIRIYVPYWISFARLPPLTLRLIDTSGKKEKKRLLARSHLERSEKHLYDIKHDELVEGYTIASGLNFKGLGLLSSVGGHGGQFGAAKELSPLGDMDGTVDLSAYDDDGKCMHILLCSKPSSYQAVPTKVIHVRPYITFTNRFGQDLYIKHSVGDEPKVLQAYDWRVSFMYSEGDTDKLQVRLADTDWCQPLEIVKEDTIVIAMRKQDGTMKFVKAEIRGYEEGSRFLIVFRLGPAYGPIRIENRTSSTTISTRQSGLGEDTWIQVKPLSTRKYSWDDPYGQKAIDVSIQKGDVACVLCVDLENPIGSYTNFREHGLKLSIVETSDIKILKFTDSLRKEEVYGSPGSELIDHQTSALKENEIELDAKPLELIVELGVVGISLIDHKPRELLYLHLQKVFISYMTGYDSGTTSRFKLILGQLQLDNQLPLSTMPVILATESRPDLNRPVFKANIAVGNVTSNGIQVYPHVYIRVINEAWRLNIHEPIIWALVDFYNNLRFVSASSSTTVTEVDPEIRIELVDISEIRLKISLETAPTQRPRGVLGVWSPVLSAVGNAFKIQVHLRKVMHRSRYMRKSSIIPAIMNRIKRDLIHNPLHLIFSVDFLGVTKSTLSSLSKGFAELSTDGQFLQLRSKQVWSRRITGVGDGLVQGTEAFAQGLAFGVSGVLRKPVESARQYGLIGIAPGLGRAFVGFIVQPLSGALDFFSLTVDGIGASFMRCVNILSNKSVPQRIRDPRAIHRDGIVREYDKVEAAGQMALYLAEASRYFACTDLFREPSKYAWSDYYEDHFILPNQRIALVTNKRVILLQCLDLDKMDKKPSKILWDVPWEEVLALELAKAGYQRPSHVIIHLKNFRRSENFVRLIKCNVDEDREPQALSLCSSVRKMWRSHQAAVKVIPLKVPSGQRHVYFASDDDKRESHSLSRSLISSRGTSSDVEQRLMNHTVNFQKMWSSEPEIRSRCKLVAKQVADDGRVFSIWRPLCPNGYISVGDVAHVGTHPPQLAAVYKNVNENFVLPLGYDLVWRNCAEDYKSPVSIWLPRPPDGYVALGCVAVPAFEEPPLDSAFCVDERLAEAAEYEEQIIWASSDAYPWGCYIYQVQSSSLQFMALRVSKEQSEQRPKKIVESLMQRAPATPRQEKQT